MARRPFQVFAVPAVATAAVVVALVALPQLATAAPSAKITEVDNHATVHNGDLTQVIADCPAGSEATGGGYTIESVNPANYIMMNAPLSPTVNDGVWGWAATLLNSSGVDVRLDVSVLCLK
jgi:hypothetical protein